jgi:hypothetical protein
MITRRLRALLVVVALGMLGGCRRHATNTVLEAGGAKIVVLHRKSADVMMTAGTVTAFRTRWRDAEAEDGILSLQIGEQRSASSIPALLLVDGVHALIGPARYEVIDGVAALLQPIVGLEGELITSIDASTSSVRLRVRLRAIPSGRVVQLRLVPARNEALVLADGGAIAPADEVSARTSPYLALGDGPALVLASNAPMSLAGAPNALSITSTLDMARSSDLVISMSLAPSRREALLRGAKLAGVAPRKGAVVTLDPRVLETQQFLPSRVRFAAPDLPQDLPLVLDPTREAEPGLWLVDVTKAGTTVDLPPGRWTMRATHGIGWSIARTELLLQDGDVLRVPFDLHQEVATPGFVGCDLHVHARGSFDAKQVSYEDRVRSLVAVGVDCAAATEHDHVGDHGPAAHALGVDDVLRALTGVELTTGTPNFGHFNVYPWPAGAEIPKTHETTPKALFDAVHALPGSFVFQLNHPRMSTGKDESIGYFDLAGVDPKTGVAHGPIEYRHDYDAIEVFNGYQLGLTDEVIALVEEWARMLDRGDVHVATGSSDSHNLSFPWAGFPRTMVDVGTGWSAAGKPIDAIVSAIKKGKVFVTSGPIVRLTVGDAGLGDEVRAAGSTARIEVRLSSWLAQPTLRLLLGADDLGSVTLHEGDAPGVFVGTHALFAVKRRRPLVAIVSSDVVGDARDLFGATRALAITNPVWLLP